MNMFSFKYRNTIFGIAATAIGYYSILLPHTILLNKYRSMTTRYKIGKEIPLGIKLHQKIQKVMDDLKLPNDVKNIIKPYSICGLDIYHAGTLDLKYGAILGIPANFTSSESYFHENLVFKEESIDWTRKDAQILLNSLPLSENAQKFAIAREILRIQAEEPYIDSILLASIIATLWTFYNYIVYLFKLRGRNVILCRTLYSTFTLFGAILWFGIKDYKSYRLDIKNDKALCSLGVEYIKGGQEFYESMLIRNTALRSLMEKKGDRMYTAHGNEYTIFRQNHVPISHRKSFFDSQLENWNTKIEV